MPSIPESYRNGDTEVFLGVECAHPLGTGTTSQLAKHKTPYSDICVSKTLALITASTVVLIASAGFLALHWGVVPL